jgi:hypothetical protein
MAARLIAVTLIFCRTVNKAAGPLRIASTTVRLLPLRSQHARVNL